MLRIGLFFGVLILFACAFIRQTPQPVQQEQLQFEIQTATPTVSLLFDAPTATPAIKIAVTPTLTVTLTPTATIESEATPSPN